MEVVEYTEQYEKQWDEFVSNKSVNGTFLQTRNFLNYHPSGKFQDASFLVYYKGKLVAVCPACVLQENEKKVLYSHKGSTFGGILIAKDYYKADKVIDIVQTVDRYFEDCYHKVVLKNTSDLFCVENGSLLEYILRYCGYSDYVELSTYIDLQNMYEDVTQNFDCNKKRNIKKCEKYKLRFRELNGNDEIEKFHELLTINLTKYGVKPVHTISELLEFRNVRIPDLVKFYGVFCDDTMMAACMMFLFKRTQTIHAQYISSDYHFEEYSASTYLYYKLIENAKKQGYKYLSWGISTENHGRQLNGGLIRNKESYGSKYALNKTFYKKYELSKDKR